jgi:hypothetical protein
MVHVGIGYWYRLFTGYVHVDYRFYGTSCYRLFGVG